MSLEKYKHVTIKGHPGVYVFMDDGDGEGPLTTEKDYEAFAPGYAHVYHDGNIMRYGEVIGTRDDLQELIEEQK